MTLHESGSKLTLRPWQRHALNEINNHKTKDFLLEACPGAGKTFPAVTHARELLDARSLRQVLILCPTSHLARQWARAAAQAGVRIEPNWSGAGLPSDIDGIAVTYQRLAAMPELYRALCCKPTLVVADEPHHMARRRLGGVRSSLPQSRRLSGCCSPVRRFDPTTTRSLASTTGQTA